MICPKHDVAYVVSCWCCDQENNPSSVLTGWKQREQTAKEKLDSAQSAVEQARHSLLTISEDTQQKLDAAVVDAQKKLEDIRAEAEAHKEEKPKE
jgi:hypothetical protein